MGRIVVGATVGYPAKESGDDGVNDGTGAVGCLIGRIVVAAPTGFLKVKGDDDEMDNAETRTVGCLTGGINVRVMGESDGGIVVVIPIVGRNTVVVVVVGDTVGCFVGRMRKAPEDVVEQSPSAVGCFVGKMRSPAVG